MSADNDTRKSIYVANVLIPSRPDTRVTTYVERSFTKDPLVTLVVKEGDGPCEHSQGQHSFAYLSAEDVDALVLQLLSAKAKL